MAKQSTSQEYFPPLREQLPAEAFASFARLLRRGERPLLRRGECLPEPFRQRINKVAYLLIDGMHRHEARPQAKHVLARLNDLIAHLRRPIGQVSTDWLTCLLILLGKDGVGEVVQSLLPPLCAPCIHPASLSRERVLVSQEELLKSALVVRRWQQSQYTRTGPEPASYRDNFILSMAQIYEDLGGDSKAYSVEQAKNHSPFAKLVRAVAKVAVKYFAPELLPSNKRPGISKDEHRNILVKRKLLRPSSMSELAISVLTMYDGRIGKIGNGKAPLAAQSSRASDPSG